MNIQLIQIYPSSTIPNRGTVHIQLPEIGIEIKNICYIKKKFCDRITTSPILCK